MSAILEVRARRAHRASVARALFEGGLPEPVPGWQELGALPAWCLWPAAPRARLARLVGALFAAPGMRLWIAGERIEAARAVVGAAAFERVMRSPALPEEAPPLPLRGELARLFDGAGRAVLLGSLPAPWMRTFAAPRLPQADGQVALCPPTIARALVPQALAILAEERA